MSLGTELRGLDLEAVHELMATAAEHVAKSDNPSNTDFLLDEMTRASGVPALSVIMRTAHDSMPSFVEQDWPENMRKAWLAGVATVGLVMSQLTEISETE